MTKNLGNLFIDGENNEIRDLSTDKLITNSNVLLDTEVKKQGKASLHFNGTAKLILSQDEDFTLDSGPFTLDTWIKTAGQCCIMSSRSSGGFNGCFWFGLYGSYLRFYSGNDNWGVPYTSIVDNEWHHVAVTYDGSKINFFIDGILQISTSKILNLHSNYGLTIGADPYSGVPLNGHLDNIRLIKGQALWTSDFNMEDLNLTYANDKIEASSVYNISHRGNLRGKAKEGFIRPTIAEFFTSKDWEKIIKYLPSPEGGAYWYGIQYPQLSDPSWAYNGYLGQASLEEDYMRVQLDASTHLSFSKDFGVDGTTGLTALIELRTDNTTTLGWQRVSCAFRVGGVYEALTFINNETAIWGGHDVINPVTIDNSNFRKYLIQCKEGNMKVFTNNGTVPIIDYPITFNSTVLWGDYTDDTSPSEGAIADWKSVLIQPGIRNWQDFL